MNRWTWYHHANGQLRIIIQSANLPYKKVQNKHGKQLNFMYHLSTQKKSKIWGERCVASYHYHVNLGYQNCHSTRFEEPMTCIAHVQKHWQNFSYAKNGWIDWHLQAKILSVAFKDVYCTWGTPDGLNHKQNFLTPKSVWIKIPWVNFNDSLWRANLWGI